MNPIKLGLIVNPIAGMGGPVALKGSDGEDLQAQARHLGATGRGEKRASEFVRLLHAELEARDIAFPRWYTWGGAMGESSLNMADGVVVCGKADDGTSREDTRQAAASLIERGIDHLVFVGGDGTARDLLDILPRGFPVLGVPAGVKMHSGVFAVSPRAAALIVVQLISGRLVSPVTREVRDFDDAAETEDQIRIKTFGVMTVPEVGGYLQHTKVGAIESEPLALEEVVSEVVENIAGAQTLLIGPGTTCLEVKQRLSGQGTLRGFDAISPEGDIHTDLAAADIEALPRPVKVILSFTRNQGFLLGRGNQQLRPRFLRTLEWPHDVYVIATRTKLASLEGRPLLVDTGDESLDLELCGFVQIVSGYEDRLLYRIATHYGK